MATTTFAICCAFDDTRQIEKLKLGTINEKLARDTCQRGELICGSLRLLLGDAIKEGRLADGRETNHGNTSTTMFLDIETLTFGAASLVLLILQLRLQLRNLRSQQTCVILGGLVLLSPGVLFLELLDFVSNTHI